MISPKLMSLYTLVLVDSTKKSYEIPIIPFHGDYFHNIKKKKKKRIMKIGREGKKEKKKPNLLITKTVLLWVARKNFQYFSLL